MAIEVGKEYVHGSMLGESFVPIQCNSTYSPAHPCRVVVTKVGRKYAYAMFSGYKNPIKVLPEYLYEVETAKKLYREALEAREAMWKARGTKGLGQAFVDQCVEEL